MKNVFTRSKAIAWLLALLMLVGIAPAAMASTVDPIDQTIAVGFEEDIEVASIAYEPTSFSVKNESGESGISFLSVNTEQNGEKVDLTVTVKVAQEGKWQLSYSYSYRKSGGNKTKKGVINLVTEGYVEPTPTPKPTAEPTPEPEEEVIVEPVVEPIEEEPVEEPVVEVIEQPVEETVEEEPVEETVEEEPVEEPVVDEESEGFVVAGEDESHVEPTEDQRYLFGGMAVLQYTLDITGGNDYAAIGNMYTACDGLPGLDVGGDIADGVLTVDANTLSAWYMDIAGRDLGYNGEDFDLPEYGISCTDGIFTLTPAPVRYTSEIINMEECGGSFAVEVMVNGENDGGHFEFMVYSSPNSLGWTLSDL